MKIRKYVGATAHEAIMKLKKELGPDAVVLNTKTIRAKGILKYFKKPLVEITGGCEDDHSLRRNMDSKYDNKLDNINQELVELKKIINELPAEKLRNNNLSSTLTKFKNRLLANGIDENIAINILKTIHEQINLDDKDSNTIEDIIKYDLMDYLGNPQPIIMDGSQKTIFFVGPTGVGKTTTLAKIAASLVLEKKYEIGLVTSDIYRIGAVDQLRIYSDILELPLEVAYNKNDMYKAFDTFKNKDIILVDTAGRSHNNVEQMEELEETLNSINTKEVYLLISATIDKKILESLIKTYSFLEDFKLIITKLDEVQDYGNIFNIRYITNKELSYYTMGQSVPDDIEIINKEFIVKELMKENNNGSS